MAGIKNRDVLGLKKTPCLRSNPDKAYFCSFQSNKMKFIKDLYKKNLPFETVIKDHSDLTGDNKWIRTLVDLMKKLKWATSIDGLPVGRKIEDDNFILLWNEGDQFVELFMSNDGNPQLKSPSSQDGTRSVTPRRNLDETSYSHGES